MTTENPKRICTCAYDNDGVLVLPFNGACRTHGSQSVPPADQDWDEWSLEDRAFAREMVRLRDKSNAAPVRHATPEGGWSRTTCCGRTLWELPANDFLALGGSSVNCPGRPCVDNCPRPDHQEADRG